MWCDLLSNLPAKTFHMIAFVLPFFLGSTSLAELRAPSDQRPLGRQCQVARTAFGVQS
jgi:hypothetical protein